MTLIDLVDDAIMHAVNKVQQKHNIKFNSQHLEELADKVSSSITSLVADIVEAELNSQIISRVYSVIPNTDFIEKEKDLADKIASFFIAQQDVPTIHEVRLLREFYIKKAKK